ncbi:ATP-binding protein [Clostridium sp. UBA6640]|uniref:ATP-binding protein n=1 Tax=Clostridium sp. UBA6640 TaxID=1946370 RepID=UPI0025C2AB1E|nr:ATP-binding protein [Clostridium sp. UBA6640]
MAQAANKLNISSEVSVEKNSDDILVLVNREHSLDKNYKPNDLIKPNVRFFSDMTKEEKLMRKEAGGSGLGLAITKNIIQLHNGKIATYSDEEKTIFKVKLPLLDLTN